MNSGRQRRDESEAAGRVLPLGVLYAQFIDVYGSREFHDPCRWPTRDGVIPFLLFYQMVGAMANVRAAHQLVIYYATLLAGAQINGGEDGRSQRDDAVRSLVETAYPSDAARTPAKRTVDHPVMHVVVDGDVQPVLDVDRTDPVVPSPALVPVVVDDPGAALRPVLRDE